ncbi:MAG: lipopolysaccharide heptosyltransferase II [Pseudomonadota bacterium]
MNIKQKKSFTIFIFFSKLFFMKHNLKNILFVQMGGIGNMVMLTPTIQLFMEKYPDAKLHFLVSKTGNKLVIEKNPQLGQIIELDSNLMNFTKLIMRIKKLNCELMFISARTNILKSAILGILSGIKYRLGENRGLAAKLLNVKNEVDTNLHDVMVNINLARNFIDSEEVPDTILWTCEKDRTEAQEFIKSNRKLIGIHPGSGPFMGYKRWPLENFIELIKKLITLHPAYDIVIFGGKEEEAFAEKIRNNVKDADRLISACGKLSLRASFELMKKCELFITNDSGPMHLASASGTKILALFGPTSEKISGPWGKGHTIIRSKLDCSPCYYNKEIKCEHYACMKKIDVDTVYQKCLVKKGSN